MKNRSLQPLVFKSREFSAAELELIREVVGSCPGLSRQELANTACELLEWRRPSGGLKVWECRELLERLESDGWLTLPALSTTKPKGTSTSIPRTSKGEPLEEMTGSVGEFGPVVLHRVVEHADRLLWRELVGRYHYLGHKVPFGAHLRYLIEVRQAEPRVVGCLQLSSPAWKMAPRDRWIGWDAATRERNLQRIVNNSRFLLLPWVRIRNLASTVLSKMSRQVAGDWQEAYGLRPLLVETLVDEERFRGSCYRAANWVSLGVTQGRGRMDRHHRRQGESRKRIFVYPLVKGARRLLCSGA